MGGGLLAAASSRGGEGIGAVYCCVLLSLPAAITGLAAAADASSLTAAAGHMQWGLVGKYIVKTPMGDLNALGSCNSSRRPR